MASPPAKTAQRRAMPPAQPAVPVVTSTELADTGKHNLYWQIEQAEDGSANLVLVMSLHPDVVAQAYKSEKGNLIISSSQGFSRVPFPGLVPGIDLGLNLNLMGKASKAPR